jgi:FMN phosphatase YigB (HAD superfamily)
MYKLARSEHTIAFDCDDTLIIWDENHMKPFDDSVKLICPHDGAITYHRVHKRHVEFLKKQHAKGYTVIVWSSAGSGWAESVVKSLNLEKYVDFVMSKPQKWVDDATNPADVLGVRVFLSEEGYSR